MIEPTGQPTRIKKATTKLMRIYNRCLPVWQQYALPVMKHTPEVVKLVSSILRILEWLP